MPRSVVVAAQRRHLHSPALASGASVRAVQVSVRAVQVSVRAVQVCRVLRGTETMTKPAAGTLRSTQSLAEGSQSIAQHPEQSEGPS